MKFSGIVTAERKDDQMGVMFFFAADDHLDRGFYIEMPCQLPGFPNISRYLFSGDHHLCS